MKNKQFTVKELSTGIELRYKDLQIHIDTTRDGVRNTEEILSLLSTNKNTYSWMCTSRGMPFSHIENKDMNTCILCNLDALEKLDRIDSFRSENSENGIYKVFLQEVIVPENWKLDI